MRPVLLGAVGVTSSLCISFSAGQGVNIPLAVIGSVLAAVLVLMTSVPPEAGAGGVRSYNSLAIGIAVGALSSILHHYLAFTMSLGLGIGFNNIGFEPTPEGGSLIAGGLAIGFIYAKIPFDLLLGAGLLSRASSVITALVTAVAVYVLAIALSIVWGAAENAFAGFDPLTSAQGEAFNVVMFAGVVAASAYAARILNFLIQPRTGTASNG